MSWKLKALAVLNVAGWAILVPLLVSNLLHPFLNFDKWPGSTLDSRPAQQARLPDARRLPPPRSPLTPREPGNDSAIRVGPVTITTLTLTGTAPAPIAVTPSNPVTTVPVPGPGIGPNPTSDGVDVNTN